MAQVKLTALWFEAQFLRETTETGHSRRDPEKLDGADGLFLWCPCGYGKPAFPLDGGRPHGVIVSFANPRNAQVPPPKSGSQSRNGGPSRWVISGTSLGDLSLSLSVAVGSPECWHGYITNGEVTNV